MLAPKKVKETNSQSPRLRESGAFFCHCKSFLCKFFFTKKFKKPLDVLRQNEYIITVIKNDYKVHIKPMR